MNQILAQNDKENSTLSKKINLLRKQFQNEKRYQLQFTLSFCLFLFFLALFLFHLYHTMQMQKIANQLLNNYNITTLYGSNENVNTIKVNSEKYFSNPFVIGMIKIDKIKLNYPILSQSNRDLLKVSLCRFAGPNPNETGNLCIAGHNLVDNHFFSLLHELEKKDVISIFDLSGKEVIYEVYDKYEVTPNNLSCTSQKVNNQKIITLVTCNNVNGKRLIVQAKEKINGI